MTDGMLPVVRHGRRWFRYESTESVFVLFGGVPWRRRVFPWIRPLPRWRNTLAGSMTFSARAGRRGFRDYLAGLLAPSDRNKTLDGPGRDGAGCRRVQTREAQRLEHFLAHGPWDHEQVNARRLELLAADPVTVPVGLGNTNELATWAHEPSGRLAEMLARCSCLSRTVQRAVS